jgi:ribonuclease R
VQEILDQKEGDYYQELMILDEIAKNLRKKKFRNGALAFESDEVQFKLDDNGTPIAIFVKERKDAHLLIEDFMLLANKEVAAFVSKKSKGKELPFVYRIHDVPDQEKLAELAFFARELGFQMDVSSPRQIAKSLNRLAHEARSNEVLKILEPIAIRTMSKAVYSVDNIGHYGLAFPHYTHFTSPIRRYSDVLVHRLLFDMLTTHIKQSEKFKLSEQCKHISNMERKAQRAERESVKYKQVEYMKNHIGEVFEGYVSGMIDRGIFVELLDNWSEGMIGFDKMNETFHLDNSRLRAIGSRSKSIIKMGDKVKVRILNADTSTRQIEMELADHL